MANATLDRLVSLPVLSRYAAAPDRDAFLADNGIECGECRACCTLRPVELEAGFKADHQVCPHECADGCERYETRPLACRDYACMWRSGALQGTAQRRPDRLGLMFEAVELKGLSYIAAWETRPAAVKEPQARYLVDRLSERALVVVLDFNGTGHQLFGPEALADAWRSRCGMDERIFGSLENPSVRGKEDALVEAVRRHAEKPQIFPPGVRLESAPSGIDLSGEIEYRAIMCDVDPAEIGKAFDRAAQLKALFVTQFVLNIPDVTGTMKDGQLVLAGQPQIRQKIYLVFVRNKTPGDAPAVPIV